MITKESKTRRLNSGWLAVMVLSVVFVASAFAQEEPVVEELQMPGTIEGTGTYFEVTDSNYLNITFQSSEPVNLRLESVPQMVIMHIEAAEGASSTWITLTGFAPSTTYYKYEDDYHNEVVFTTDGSGSYTFEQDLAIPHCVFIQPQAGTIFLSDLGWRDENGNDPGVGTWDPLTKTGTLTTDVYETIQIDSDGIILDGNGKTVTGSGTGYGVHLPGRTGVTMQSLNVHRFTYGIYLYVSSGNTLTGNAVNLNHWYGIYLYGSSGNTLTDNTASNNNSGIHLYVSSGNTLTDNTASNNYEGIYFYYSRYNTLTRNTTSNNWLGIRIWDSWRNTLAGNTVTRNNRDGIRLWSSSNNTLRANTVESNNGYGIYIMGGSSNNQIYNNNFIDNWSQQARVYGGNVFSLDKPTGGNYWDNWTSPDNDGDGFVDYPYVFYGGQDNLPWVVQDGWLMNQPPVANAGPDQTVEQTSSDGAEVQLDGSGSYDPDEDPLTYLWTWEGGSASGVAPVVQLPPGLTTITLTVSDGKLFDEDTVEVTVKDTIPPETTIDAPQPYGLYRVRDLTLAFSAYDLVSGNIEPPDLEATLSDAVGYSVPVETGDVVVAAGVYTLLVSAVDGAGNTSESEILFVVYEPEGGFVTGGGWIDSPVGAYKPDASLTGKANFGFVSKYKKGATVPTGNTEFVFKAGNLNFHSSSYDWLVVTGSDYARFKGSGTINSEGNYKFMLWAGDGEPDTFRIRIWTEDEGGVETDIYDNGFDQAIGGGSIVIHTK